MASSAAEALSTEALEKFSQGLASVLRQWTVLTLAVTNQWGGTDSEDKAAMLFDEILEEFLHPKERTLYRDYLEAYIHNFLDQEFYTVAEDGSVEEISHSLIRMFAECSKGNYELVEATIAHERSLPPNLALAKSIPMAGDDDDDDDDGNDDGKAGEGSATLGAIEEEGEEKAPEPKKEPVAADEDGWFTVTKDKRTRKGR